MQALNTLKTLTLILALTFVTGGCTKGDSAAKLEGPVTNPTLDTAPAAPPKDNETKLEPKVEITGVDDTSNSYILEIVLPGQNNQEWIYQGQIESRDQRVWHSANKEQGVLMITSLDDTLGTLVIVRVAREGAKEVGEVWSFKRHDLSDKLELAWHHDSLDQETAVNVDTYIEFYGGSVDEALSALRKRDSVVISVAALGSIKAK